MLMHCLTHWQKDVESMFQGWCDLVLAYQTQVVCHYFIHQIVDGLQVFGKHLFSSLVCWWILSVCGLSCPCMKLTSTCFASIARPCDDDMKLGLVLETV